MLFTKVHDKLESLVPGSPFHQARLKRPSREQHSSLLLTIEDYDLKRFNIIGPWSHRQLSKTLQILVKFLFIPFIHFQNSQKKFFLAIHLLKLIYGLIRSLYQPNRSSCPIQKIRSEFSHSFCKQGCFNCMEKSISYCKMVQLSKRVSKFQYKKVLKDLL